MISRTISRWLPDTALKSKRVYQAIEACAADWLEIWAAKESSIKIAPSRRVDGQNAQFSESKAKGGIAIEYRSDRSTDLAGILLGRQIGPKDIRTQKDGELVKRLINEALSDLLAHLNKALPMPGTEAGNVGGEDQGLELTMTLSGIEHLIRVTVDHSVLLEHALRNSRPPRQSSPFTARAVAVSEQTLCMNALVGRTKLELGELAEIGVGDVLVLDRSTGQHLDLMLNNRVRGADSACLSLDNGRLTLSIERPVDQW